MDIPELSRLLHNTNVSKITFKKNMYFYYGIEKKITYVHHYLEKKYLKKISYVLNFQKSRIVKKKVVHTRDFTNYTFFPQKNVPYC